MGKRAIVCVDDERMVLVSLRDQLISCLGREYVIELAESGEEALEVFEELMEEGITVPLIVADQIMPGMKGDELLIEIHTQYPRTLTIMLTGQAHAEAVGNAVNNAGLYRYIAKPWEATDLCLSVTEALRRYDQDRQLEKQHQELQHLYALAQQEIVERKRAQLALQKANEELEERVKIRTAELVSVNTSLKASNVALDAFAHTVAHDLKNPLGVILGYADILLMDYPYLDEDMIQKYLPQIQKVTRKSLNIMEELLILAGVRKAKIKAKPLDMAEIIEHAQDRLKFMITEYQAEIKLPQDWPVALGHAPWVEEIWVNYLSNGLKYGGRPPHLQLGYTLGKDNMVRYWIRDNGLGLSQEEQSQLFTEFTRLDHNTRVKGYGLGLAIVRQIVEKLEGEAGVESKVGRGSKFYFTLPRAESGV